nr:hypothetical protein [Tanacetum cinerariifolium]
MLVHMVMIDMKLLVGETETADITADDVDTVFYLTDVERSKQVGQKFVHSSIKPRWHDIHVDQDMHEVDRRRGMKSHLTSLHSTKLSSLPNGSFRSTLSCNALVPKPHHEMSSAALWHLPSFVLLPIRNSISQAPEKVAILQADAQPIPIPTEPSTSKPQKKYKQKRKHTKELEVPPTESQAEHNVPLPLPSYDLHPSGEDTEAYNLDLDHQEKVLSMLDVNDEELAGEEEVVEVFTAAKLINEVVTTTGVDINTTSVQDTPITAAEATKVQENDKGKAILIEEPKPLKRINVPEKEVRQEKEVKVESSKREDQMVNNVRLEVDDESKMSLELLRLVRRQLNEGGGLLGIIGLHKLVMLDQLSVAA